MPLPPEPPALQKDMTEATVAVVQQQPQAEVEVHKGPCKTISLDEATLSQLSPADKKILLEIDVDKSGHVDIAEILGLLRTHRDNKAHMKKMFKTFFFVVLALSMLL